MTRAAAEERVPEPAPLDLSNCEREPIRIPGAVQPHGLLLALREPDLTILQASDNAAAVCGTPAEALVGRTLDALLESGRIAALRRALAGEADGDATGGRPSAVDAGAGVEQNPLYLFTVPLGKGRRPYNALFHRHAGVLILDLEPAADPGAASLSFQNLHPLVRTAIARLQSAHGTGDICRLTATEVRRITGFDRVMVYQFDENWNGAVVAEDKRDDLPPFLGHHYPASDIPAQARELYRINRVRLIADVGYEPSRLVPPANPQANGPLDLTYSTIRSVSPVHVEYLKNMGVGSSMSVSILREDPGNPGGGPRLWGLIACHHATARFVPYEVRTACDFLGQVLAMQLASKEAYADAEHRVAHKSILTRLLQEMALSEDFTVGLARNEPDLLAYANAHGAGLYFDGRCTCVGRTPTEAQVAEIVRWLQQGGAPAGGGDVYHTDSLSAAFPPAAAYKDVASGLLAASISRVHESYLLWFRPEVIQTVNWAGEPHKPATPGWDGRLHPRKSFELWKEVVRDRSLPWQPAEVAAAADLRNAVVGIVLKRAEELAQLTAELERSNKELEAFSYSVSHDLRAPFRHIVGFADLLQKRAGPTMDETGRRYVSTIVESARYAGHLVDSLLTFSQMGRASLRLGLVDMAALVADVVAELRPETAGRDVEWRVDPRLPPAHADLMMVRLVVRNLLANAVKYTRTRAKAVIEVGVAAPDDVAPPLPRAAPRPAEAGGGGPPVTYFVRDNGVGFDMQYVEKLFGVFQRLHRAEDFEGTGIGLANVKRIVERHGGRAWAVGALDAGATFYFSLPAAEPGA